MSTETPHVLDVVDITKRFSSTGDPAVDRVSFSVMPGEIFALLGPSGCGKTTTLRVIAGFEKPDGGEVRLADVPITGLSAERRKIGIVFQDYALFPHLTVLRNVMFGLKTVSRVDRARRARQVLEKVGLALYGDRMPHELSGGQQQRVALARALAAEPKIILLDEPFSNLDAELRRRTRREVRALLKSTGMSAVLVTHDQEEALAFSDRLAVMTNGRIEQIGEPEDVYVRPRTSFVAHFLGRTNVFVGRGCGFTAETSLGTVGIDREASGPVLLSLRPEHIDIAIGGSDSPAIVTSREFKGHDITYRVALGKAEYLVHTEYTMKFLPGDRVKLVPRESAVVLDQSVGHPFTKPLNE